MQDRRMETRFLSEMPCGLRRRAGHSASYEVFFRSPTTFSDTLPDKNLGANASNTCRIVEWKPDFYRKCHADSGDKRGIPTPILFYSPLNLPSQKHFPIKISVQTPQIHAGSSNGNQIFIGNAMRIEETSGAFRQL